MFKPALFLLIALGLSAYQSNSTADKKDTTKKQTKQIAAGKDSFITTPCAVIINPTLHQVDSMKAKIDSNDFYTIADDQVYYESLADSYLDSVKIKQIEKDAKGVIAFKTMSGRIFRFKLDTLIWHVLLFNGKSKPINADKGDMETSFKAYMKKLYLPINAFWKYKFTNNYLCI